VLQKVAKALPFQATVPQLAGAVHTTSQAGTVILRITASDESPAHAAAIANQTATSLGEVARDLSPKNSKGEPTVDVDTIGPAKVPAAPSSPRTKRDLALGLAGGIAIAVFWAMLREKLDTRLRSPEEISSEDIPILGSAELPRGSGTRVAVLDSPTSMGAESYRRLRTSLLFTQNSEDSSVAISITSPSAAEGKSTTALNLAGAFAETGQRVLLIDADLRRPTVADRLDLEGAVGLSTVLAGRAPFEEVVQPVGGDSTLDVLAAGTIPPNPTQLLGSARMRDLIKTVRGIYDVVVVDTPPLLAVADAAVIAPLTSGCVLVVRQGRTRVAEIRDALSALSTIETAIFGVVISRRARILQRQDPYGRAPQESSRARHRPAAHFRGRRTEGRRGATQQVGDFR